MPSLLDVQHAVRRSLVERDDRDAAAWIAGDGLAPAQRLGIYRNTFTGALTNALRLAFPAVHRLVGAEFFDGAARIFVHERPPRGAYLNEYGAEFPEFLARFPAAAALPYIADVARLEWAVNRALHAADVDPLDVARLAAIPPGTEERIRFTPHPSVGLVRADCPVDAVWRAVLDRDDRALAAIDLAAGPVFLMAQRLADGVDVARLEERAWRFAADLFAGETLGDALDASADIDAPVLLAEHLDAGRFIDFQLTLPAAARDKEPAP